MQYALLSLALAALASASLEERSTSSGGLSNVLADLKELTGDLSYLNVAINAPNPASSPYTQDQLNNMLSYGSLGLGTAQNLTKSLQNSAQFNQADSANLGSALISSLEPSITAVPTNLVSHKAGIQGASATSVASVVLSQASVNALSVASLVVQKVSGPTATASASHYSSAIASVYSSAHKALGF